MNKSSKGINYNLYKKEHRLETYLTELPLSLAISTFLFRTANHKLPVETGKWNGTAYNERTCQLCNTGRLGDEMHYLFSCPALSTQRHYFLAGMQLINTTHCYEKIMSFSSGVDPVKICKFMSLIMKEVKRLRDNKNVFHDS